MKDEEIAILICIPVDGGEPPISGSSVHKCCVCGCDVFASIASIDAMLDTKNKFYFICIHCYEYSNEDEFLPLSEDQIKEITDNL